MRRREPLATVRAGMDDRAPAFPVTLIKVGLGLPQVEVGAYEYVSNWLPAVGDTIPIRRRDAASPEGESELRGYVTRVNPAAETPISVTEVTAPPPSLEELIVQRPAAA